MLLPAIDPVKTGENILGLRKGAGYSVRDLQELFGFNSPQAIYKWQSGAALPSVDNLVILASLLKVSIDDILILRKEESAGQGQKPAPPQLPGFI